MKTFLKMSVVAFLASSGFATSASAIVIDNDLSPDTVGYWAVDVNSGGQTQYGVLTANRAGGGTFSGDVVFAYSTYISLGNGTVFRLSAGDVVTQVGDDIVSSSGTFTGANGNLITWTVESSIANGSSVFNNRFSFAADEGELGTIRLFQYLDEDVDGPVNDVFFTRGSVAGRDLELFTVDSDGLFGVSHGGAYDSAGGLENATFAGWAACTWDTQVPAILDGTQTVSTSGEICSGLPQASQPGIGTVYGPHDIVSLMAWDVSSSASASTIVTTLGGLPDITRLPPDEVPEPAALGLFGVGLLGLAASRRRRRAGSE